MRVAKGARHLTSGSLQEDVSLRYNSCVCVELKFKS